MIINEKKLIKVQEKLKKKLILKDDFESIENIAGVDVAYKDDKAVCAVVIMNRNKIILKKTRKSTAKFPYIPGFFAFREAPPIIKTVKGIKNKIDILLVNGHGIAHPRGFGLASHVGLILNLPTIGIASSLLCGEVRDGYIFLNNKKVGYQYRKIYVSPGHRISLPSSIQIVKGCMHAHRLPEPLHRAHKLAKKILMAMDE